MHVQSKPYSDVSLQKIGTSTEVVLWDTLQIANHRVLSNYVIT